MVVTLLCVAYSSDGAADTSVPEGKGDPAVLEVSIKDVVDNPREYNGKQVALEGRVKKVEYTKSSKGEPFTLFKLKDGDNNEVNVYYEDEHLPISKGDSVKIMGKFRKQKSYLFYKIENVIKARTVESI